MAYVWSSPWVKGIWDTGRDLTSDPGVLFFDSFAALTDVGSGRLMSFGTQSLRFASVHNWYDWEDGWGILADGTVTLKIEDSAFEEVATIGADTPWSIDLLSYDHAAAASEKPTPPIPPYKDVPELFTLTEKEVTVTVELGTSPAGSPPAWGLVMEDGSITQVTFYATVTISYYTPRYGYYGKNLVRFYGDADPQSDDTRRYYAYFRTVVEVSFYYLPTAGGVFIGAGLDDQYNYSPSRRYDTVWSTDDTYDEEIVMDVLSGIPTDYKMNEATSTLIRAAMPTVEGGPPKLRRIGSAEATVSVGSAS